MIEDEFNLARVDCPSSSVAPIVLSAQQVAQMWSVSLRTIERWIAAGEFPQPIKQGAGNYWHFATLDQ